MAKVLLLNGSPRADGCTATALQEMIKIFEAEDIETELIQIGGKNIRGCIACNKCNELGCCVFDDAVNKAAKLLEECDWIYMIAAGDPVSAQKIERLENVLEKMKMEDLRRKFVRLQIPFMDHLPQCLEAHNRGKLSEWVRKFMIAEEKHGLSGVEAEITESCD